MLSMSFIYKFILKLWDDNRVRQGELNIDDSIHIELENWSIWIMNKTHPSPPFQVSKIPIIDEEYQFLDILSFIDFLVEKEIYNDFKLHFERLLLMKS